MEHEDALGDPGNGVDLAECLRRHFATARTYRTGNFVTFRRKRRTPKCRKMRETLASDEMRRNGAKGAKWGEQQ